RQSMAGEFKVTDFVPTQFKVGTLIAAEQLHPGDSVAARVRASLHSGGPYTDAEVKLSTRIVPRRFVPDNAIAERFHFGPADELPDSKTISTIEGRLDHDGQVDFETRLPEDIGITYGSVRVAGQVKSARSTWVTNVAHVPYAARSEE